MPKKALIGFGPHVPPVSGWGSGGWGGFAWGGGGGPLPTELPEYTGIRIPRHKGLGHLTTVLVRPGQDDVPVVVGNLEENESAPGGVMSLAGVIDPDAMKRQPDLYSFGTVMRVFHTETGWPVYGGIILDPDPVTGQFSSRGWGTLFERNFGALLYQDMSYAHFSPADGDPYGYGQDSNFSLSSDHGRLLWQLNKGSTFPGDSSRHTAGFVFWNQENEITHFRATIHSSDAELTNGGRWRIRIFKGFGPDGAVTEDTSSGYQVNEGDPIDRDVSDTPGDLLVVRLSYEGSGSNFDVPKNLRAWLTNIAVDGVIKGASSFTVSDVFRDVCGRFGVSDAFVNEEGTDCMPQAWLDGTYAENLMPLMLLIDWRYFVADLGFGPVASLGPWSSNTWIVPDKEAPVDLVSVERFNVVAVPFWYTGTTTSGQVLVRADPDPFPNYDNVYTSLSLTDPQPGKAYAQTLGQNIANLLSQVRYGGGGSLESVEALDGSRVPAWFVRPGDTLYLPYRNGAIVRAKTVRRTATSCEFEWDQGLAALDKMLQLRRHRLMLRGYVG